VEQVEDAPSIRRETFSFILVWNLNLDYEVGVVVWNNVSDQLVQVEVDFVVLRVLLVWLCVRYLHEARVHDGSLALED